MLPFIGNIILLSGNLGNGAYIKQTSLIHKNQKYMKYSIERIDEGQLWYKSIQMPKLFISVS